MAWYLIVIIIIVIFVAFYALASLFAAHLFVKSIVTPHGKSRRTVEEIRGRDKHYEDIDFGPYDRAEKEKFMLPAKEGEDTIELSCVLIRAGQASLTDGKYKPKHETCVILPHGLADNKDNSIKYAYDFLSFGMHVLIYDHRAFGDSTGKYCSMGIIESEDLSAVITEARRRLGEHVEIGLHGESMGSMTSLILLKTDSSIKFVVSDCGPTYLRDFAKEAYRAMTHLPIGWAAPIMNAITKRRYGFTMDDVRPADGVATSDVPILFIHGTEDKLVPTRMCPELYKLARNPHSKMVLFEGAIHARSHSQDPAKYRQVLLDFLQDIDVL